MGVPQPRENAASVKRKNLMTANVRIAPLHQRNNLTAGQCPVWMAPALQAIFAIAMVCQYSRVSGLFAWRSATGHDEFRKQGSYRLNDLGGRDIGRSVLTLG